MVTFSFLLFQAVLRFLSGEPAEGAKLSLSVWHDGDPPDGTRKRRHRVTYSADEKGEVLFTLPKLSKRVDNFQLRVSKWVGERVDG